MKRILIWLLLSSALCAAQANPADEEKRYQTECPGCAKVLISRLDTTGQKLYDNQRTESQARWLKQDTKLVKDGKLKPALWFTAFRSNAEYNVVWTIQVDSPEHPGSMEAWAWVYEVVSGRKLFQTWHRTIYWKTDHPEEQCLADAAKFLRSRRITPDGIKFANTDERQDYFPSPHEAR